MAEPCDTCGGFGNAHLIFTCSECKGHAHGYCVWTILYEAPNEDNNWLCETCLINDTISSKADVEADIPDTSILKSSYLTQTHIAHTKFSSSTPDGSGKVGANRRPSKVKYISFEEANRLSSGAIIEEPSVQFKTTPKFGQSNARKSMFGRTPTSPRVATPDFPVKRNCSFFPSGHANPPRNGSLQLNPITNKQAYTSLEELKGRTTGAVAEPNNMVAGERNLLNFLAKVGQFLPHLPTLEVTWKGAFETRIGEIYGEFCGRPSSKIHPKAYEFSKKMPELLLVKFLPRHDLWADLFQDSCPDLGDIALYFLPSNFARSKENSVLLFMLMEKRDVVMKSYIDGVELFVVTSKQLLWDLPNGTSASNNDHFLWGIFRPAKNDANIDCSKDALDDTNMEGRQSFDMEIDMVSRQNVGRVDVTPSTSCRRDWKLQEIGTIQQTPEVKITTPSNNTKWSPMPISVKSEKEDWNDIPPGFEQMPKG